MPTCYKCNEKFPNTKMIDGKRRHLGKRKFCIKCSPFGCRNRRDLTKPYIDREIRHKIKYQKVCSICEKLRTISSHSNICATCKGIRDRQRRKDKAVELFGGKCGLCGYSKCQKSFNFHHIDPINKKSQLSNIWRNSWEEVLEELKKCILICRNCHGEVHDGIYSKEQIEDVFIFQMNLLKTGSKEK